jgi:hypothetical protein
VIIDNHESTGAAMSEKRVIRKMKKLAARISDKMESIHDVMEDLEIEFEMLQKQIQKLESKKGSNKISDAEEAETTSSEQDDEDEVVDLENTSVVTLKPKF